MKCKLIVLATLINVTCLCSEINEYYKISGRTQGTTYTVIYHAHTDKDIRSDIEKLLALIDTHFSIYNPNSIVSKINRNDVYVNLTPLFVQLFKKSFEIYYTTNGAFDITVGPLVNAWGFGKTEKQKLTQKQIDSLLQFVGMDKIALKNGKIEKKDTRIAIDFNAIAQGYSVDIITNYLDSLRIQNYLVEIGGELRTKGVNASGKFWRIGIERPEDNNYFQGKNIQQIVEVSNYAIATSGNYRKFYIENGIKYSHTIDPKTGYPTKNNLLSVTIIYHNCTEADAFATACMVMGLKKSQEWLKKHPNIAAYLIYSDKKGNLKEYFTDSFKKFLVN